MPDSANTLSGRTIAFLAADEVEKVEVAPAGNLSAEDTAVSPPRRQADSSPL